MVSGCSLEGMQSQDKQENTSIVLLNAVTLNTVVFPEWLRVLNGSMVKCPFDMCAEYCFISYLLYINYTMYKKLK